MRVFIANFGRENYKWSECLSQNTITTMHAEAVHDFWIRGDRESYVNYCIAHLRTATGNVPTRPVASRWFNLMTIVAETAGDVWIHREKARLWWTISKAETPTIALEVDQKPLEGSPKVFVAHKACEPWSNNNKMGNRLEWNALHPKAKQFLFTEGTLQQLAEDHAAYALALIAGDDLTSWHSQAGWKRVIQAGKRNPGIIFNARQRSIWEMVNTVKQTVRGANGQQVLRTVKNKEMRLSEEELCHYVNALIDDQDGACAITGIALQYAGEAEDTELQCSLDRIDSDGHYEAGNLQVVCRFVNRWKNSGEDDEFRRLIRVVRSSV